LLSHVANQVRILAPALQGVRADPNLSGNQVDYCALRRQQPRQRSVFECLSVSSQVRPSSPPPGFIYGGDNYSDAGGKRGREIALTTGLPRNTVAKCLNEPQQGEPRHRRTEQPGKRSAFHAVLKQALKVDVRRYRHEQRIARALHAAVNGFDQQAVRSEQRAYRASVTVITAWLNLPRIDSRGKTVWLAARMRPRLESRAV